MIVIDTSVWIELFRNGPKVEKLRPFLAEAWIVPEITMAEVSAKLCQVGESDIPMALRSMAERGSRSGISVDIALRAGEIRQQHRKTGLGINDAIVWATAEYHGAKLLTLDYDFKPFKDALIL